MQPTGYTNKIKMNSGIYNFFFFFKQERENEKIFVYRHYIDTYMRLCLQRVLRREDQWIS